MSDPLGLDQGTLPRTELPPPGPIGLDSRSGAPARAHVNLGGRVVRFPRQRMGQRVGDGECFALADGALRNAGARTAEDFGTVIPDADYVWGSSVSLADVQPGDIVQFRDYRYDREVETRNADGSIVTNTDFQERPHHTAIVERVDGNGAITVLEQNSPSSSPVVRRQLFFSNGTRTSGTRTTTITVQGTFWFYRPQSR
jgi:hypothetical protein